MTTGGTFCHKLCDVIILLSLCKEYYRRTPTKLRYNIRGPEPRGGSKILPFLGLYEGKFNGLFLDFCKQ